MFDHLLAQINKLCNTGRVLTVSGIGGKIKIKGVIWIDLDQGVKLRHTVLVCNVGGSYDTLLGKRRF